MLHQNPSFRGVAQLVARMAGGHEVVGSSPATPTIDKEQLICIITTNLKIIQMLDLHAHRGADGSDRATEQAVRIHAQSLLLQVEAEGRVSTRSLVAGIGLELGMPETAVDTQVAPQFPIYTDHGSEELTRVLNRPLEICQGIGARIRAFRQGDDSSLMLGEVSELLGELRQVEASPDALREYEEEIATMLRGAGLNLPH